MNSRYYLNFKSTFEAEKLKKLAKTNLNVKILECDYLHLCALNEETYFRIQSKILVRALQLKDKNGFPVLKAALPITI